MALLAALCPQRLLPARRTRPTGKPADGDCRGLQGGESGQLRPGKFLEGPNFDKDGVLWMVGLMAGEILKVSKDGQCTVAKTGLNFPGGTRFDKAGKLVITTRSALVSFDTQSSELTALRSLYGTRAFAG